jgi:hypothetical protein
VATSVYRRLFRLFWGSSSQGTPETKQSPQVVMVGVVEIEIASF